MSRYTVHVEEDLEAMHESYVYGSYSDLGEAYHAVLAAERSYPKGAAWVKDEKGNMIPREDLVPPDPDPDLSYVPPDLDDDAEEGCFPDNDWTGDCPHNWQMMGDGLFHCYYFCGVRPHKPHPGEVSD